MPGKNWKLFVALFSCLNRTSLKFLFHSLLEMQSQGNGPLRVGKDTLISVIVTRFPARGYAKSCELHE